MNKKMMGKTDTFEKTPSVRSRSNLPMFKTPSVSSSIIMEMVLGHTDIDYNSSKMSYMDFFNLILTNKKVSAKLKEKNIDLKNKKLTSWREYIGLWISQK